MTVPAILLLIAVVLFVLAAVGVSGGRFNLMAAGLALVALAFLLGAGLPA